MDNKIANRIKIIYVVAFISLNIISSFLLTTDIFLKNLSPYPRNLFMITNSFFGELGFMVIFLSFAILFFKTDYNRSKFLMIMSIVLSILYVVISVYFKYYGMFFSFYNLAAFSSTGGGDAFKFLLESLFLLLTNAEFFFLISAAIMSALFIVLFHKKRKDENFKKSSVIKGINRLVIGFGIFFVGMLIMINGLSAYKVEIDDTWYEDNTTPLYGAQTVGLFNYYFYDAYSYFFTNKENESQNKIEEIKIRLEEYKKSRQLSVINNREYDNSEFHGIYEDKNLLLLQVESLNNFVIGLTVDVDGKPVEITPNLNDIVNKSVYFNNYYTNVGIGNTSDSEFTALTGLYPVGLSYTVYEYADAQYPTLPRMFNEEGYYSYSAHANTGIFYERATLHRSLYGFDYHYAEEDFDIKEEDLIHTWLNDVSLLKESIDIMKEKSAEGPVFSFTLTISSHMPYKQPSNFLDNGNWFTGKDNLFVEDFELVNSITLNNQIVGYLEHASYTDYAIGEALKYLDETGLAEDTIVVLYGDHGSSIEAHQMFYENDEILTNDINEKFRYVEDEDQRKLLERRFMANVPCIIYDPSYTEDSVDSLEPQTIPLVRGISSTTRTLANLFGLEQTYYFGVDAMSDARTFTYNPRNNDIYADGIIISGQSLNYVIDEGYEDFYTQKKIDSIVESFLNYKDFNDKILKYKIFSPDTTAINYPIRTKKYD